MKIRIFYILLLAIGIYLPTQAQNDSILIINGDTISLKEPEIFDRAEINPSFPGGPYELSKFLAKNIHFDSKAAKEKGISGKIIVRFYIDVDGSVKNPVIIKDIPGSDLGEEIIRVCNIMPKWTPGQQRGKTVKVYYTLPVTFN